MIALHEKLESQGQRGEEGSRMFNVPNGPMSRNGVPELSVVEVVDQLYFRSRAITSRGAEVVRAEYGLVGQ